MTDVRIETLETVMRTGVVVHVYLCQQDSAVVDDAMKSLPMSIFFGSLTPVLLSEKLSDFIPIFASAYSTQI